MDVMNKLLQAFLGYAVELMKLIPIMLFAFKFEIQPIKRTVIISVCSAAVLVLAVVSGIEDYVPIYSYLGIVLTILIVKGENRILYTLTGFFGISLLDMLTATVFLAISGDTYERVIDDTFGRLSINALNIAVIAVICLAARKLSSKKNDIIPIKVGKPYLILIILGEISLLSFMTIFQLNDNTIEGADKAMAIALGVGSAVFILTAFIMVTNYFSKNYYKGISEINEKLVKSQEQYYTMLLQKEEETRKFRHDINNHLNCMRLLLKKKKFDELENYFNRIGASILELRSELQIGHDLISAILKDVADKHSEVSVDIIGKLPSSIRLDNTDVCTIFYNLFDNAFTAAQSSEKKSVEISVKLLGENLFFIIKNTVLRKVEIENNILKTDKQDKEQHGFGSGNAIICAEKNGGTLTYKCSDTHFEAELIIPNII